VITQWVIDLVAAVWSLLVSAMGTAAAPGWLTGLTGQLDSLVAAGSSMGVWVPWSVFGPALASVVVCAGIAFAVRMVRMLLSLFTGGGGSAA
jgi:hypothetical protein